jgi:hypothetical protein
MEHSWAQKAICAAVCYVLNDATACPRSSVYLTRLSTIWEHLLGKFCLHKMSIGHLQAMTLSTLVYCFILWHFAGNYGQLSLQQATADIASWQQVTAFGGSFKSKTFMLQVQVQPPSPVMWITVCIPDAVLKETLPTMLCSSKTLSPNTASAFLSSETLGKGVFKPFPL